MSKSKERRQKAWIKKCWNHHSQYISELDVAPDWGDWDTDWNMCWCCGHSTIHLQKCHLTPRSLGGSDDPSNIVPLCSLCHDKAPDVLDPQVMIDWIKDNQNSLSNFGLGRYNHLWDFLMSEYKEKNLNLDNYDDFVFKYYLNLNYGKISAHGSQTGAGAVIKESTREWVFKQTIKDCELNERTVS